MPQALLTRPTLTISIRLRSAFWSVCTVILLVGYIGIITVCGADPLAMLRFFIAAVFWLILPGWSLAAILAPRASSLSLFVIVYGAGFLAAVQCIAARFGAFWLIWLIPPMVGLSGIAYRFRNQQGVFHRIGSLVRSLLSGPWGTLWAGLCLAYAICCSAVNPHPLQAGAAALDRDFLWNIGNAEALMRNFPAEDLRVSGIRLAYHYLTELLWAALARVSGAKLFDVYFYFAGPLFLIAELLALQVLASCCWPEHRWAKSRYLALVFGFSCLSMWKVLPNGLSLFGNTLLAHLITNVNSQATALPFFAGAFCMYATLARNGMRGNGKQWLALFVSFALLCVAKGPQAALLLCGLVAVSALLLLLRRIYFLPTLGGLVGLGLIFAALYKFLYAAGTGSMEFSIFAMRETLVYRVLSPLTDKLCTLLPGSGYFWLLCLGVCDTFCMLPFQCMLCLYALPAAFHRLRQPDPARLLAAALSVGGMLAYHLFYHSSSSQIYFALLAMLCLSLLAAGAPERLPHGWKRIPVVLTGVAGLITTICLVFSFTGRAVPSIAACIGLSSSPTSDMAVTSGDETAMQWFRENSSPTDIFTTNRISGTPSMIDAISNVYTGLSGRQAYLEGWTYAATNMGVSKEILDYKRWINEELTGGTLTGTEARKLAEEEGIQWMILAKAWPGNAPNDVFPVYENKDVAIYRFDQVGENP